MGEKKTTIGEGLGFYKEYVVGMMAGVATVVVGHPFDTVKVKLLKHNTEVQGQEHHFWTAGKDIDEAIIVDEKTDKVIGASMCGPDAAEIMQGIAIALKCGAAKAQFDNTVGIHPSSAEEFVTMHSVTRRIAYKPKPKMNL